MNNSNRSWIFIDKSRWLRGPWDNEPDKVQWVDEATGLPCVIRRSPLGSLAGYVGVMDPERNHPARSGKFCVPVTFGDYFWDPRLYEEPPFSHSVDYGYHFVGGDKNLFYIGFHAGHDGDFCPAPPIRGNPRNYRDIGYVRDRCSELAGEIKKLEATKK